MRILAIMLVALFAMSSLAFADLVADDTVSIWKVGVQYNKPVDEGALGLLPDIIEVKAIIDLEELLEDGIDEEPVTGIELETLYRF